jgi:hypothetical protein
VLLGFLALDIVLGAAANVTELGFGVNSNANVSLDLRLSIARDQHH